MHLRALTDNLGNKGKLTGTGTIDLKAQNVKSVKVLVTTNNSAAAVVILRKVDSSGDKIFDLSTITAGDYPAQPVLVDGTDLLYYDITGTGAAAQIYGAVA